MAESPDIDDVLEYLETDYKSRRQIEKEFKITNIQSWHMCNWLESTKLVLVLTIKRKDSPPSKLYKSKKC